MQNIVSLGKLSYRGLLISIKLSTSENQHLKGFLKSSNKTVNRGAMTPEPSAHTECRQNYKILLLMMLTSVLTQKSNT